MKRLLLIMLSVFAMFGTGKAQTLALPPLQPEQDACNALVLCGNSFTTPYTYTGYGQTQEMNIGSCLVENRSVWFKITVAAAGSIVFTVTPINPVNDYDFAVIDITNASCSSFSYGNVIRCNANANYAGSNPGGVVGLNTTSTLTYVAAGAFGNSFLQQINANVGDVYLIIVDNAGNYIDNTGEAGFTIDFTGTTAVFNQGPTPELSYIEPACQRSEGFTVKLSQPVMCSSIAADGSDFSLSPSGTITSATGVNCTTGGYTDEIQLTFAPQLPPGSYILNAQTGTDGNTLLNLCGAALIPPDTLHFVVDPANNPLMLQPDTPGCFKLRVPVSHGVACGSVAPNGSDFAVSGPSPVSVIKAVPISCSPTGFADTIDVYFNKSIEVPGQYTLSVVTGTDGDMVVDTCGYNINNTVTWTVSDQGYLSLSATPNVLCEKGYVALDATALIGPPPSVSGCGINTTGVVGTASPYQIGTSTANTSNYPFLSYYMDGRTQILLKASELISQGLNAGTFTKLALNVATKNSTQPFGSFTIKMGCTNLTDLTAGFAPSPQVVFTPKSVTTVIGTNNFTLDNPYDWDGTSNLLIEICYDNSSYTNWDYVSSTGTSYTSVYYQYYDLSTNSGCTLATGAGFGGTSSMRPNITLYQVPPPPSIHTYLWTPSDFVADSTSNHTTAFVTHSTVYHMQIMDSNRCYRRDTVSVTLSIRNPQLTPVQKDTAICFGDHIDFHASGGVNYVWFPTDGLSCANCADPVATPATTITYHVAIFDTYGCSDTLTRHVVVHPLPVVYAGPDTTIIYGTPLQLNSNTPGGLYYLWDPVTGLNDANVPNPIATPEVTTVYTLIVVDTNLCRSSDSVKVTVRTDIPVNIPSAFSPNGDGLNDVFHIANLRFQKLVEFRVFNRWGQEVFSTNDNTKGWDGTSKGTAQEMGVYNYVIRVAWPDGHVETYKGDVTLVR